MSNAVSPAVPVRRTPRPATARTSVSPVAWVAGRSPVLFPRHKPNWCAIRWRPDNTSVSKWKPFGKPASNGRMPSWRLRRLPKPPKKGAPDGLGKRSPPRSRSPLRSRGGGRTGFRGPGNGPAPGHAAAGGLRHRTTAECRHLGRVGFADPLPLWRGSAVCRTPEQAVPQRAGDVAFGARLLSLFFLWSRWLSPRSTARDGEHRSISGTHAHDRHGRRHGQFSGRQPTVAGTRRGGGGCQASGTHRGNLGRGNR